MAKDNSATLGYFTVAEDSQTGWTGGLLVLNASGRPLEFQCTLPVRTSRAHEILYGPTLRGHLIGEVIGPLLVEKCRTPISLLCCDQPEALALETVTKAPVGLIKQAAEAEEGPLSDDALDGYVNAKLADTDLFVPIEKSSEIEALVDQFCDLPDALEPLARIREAIQEAHSQLARQKPSQAA